MFELFRKKSEIDVFWRWLAANTERIQSHDYKRDFKAIGNEIGEAFSSAYPELVWEIGPSKSQPWQFCVSADGNPKLFSRVKQAVHAAPAIVGWKIQTFRSRGSLNAVIDMGARKLGYENIWCSVEPQGKGARVTLWIDGLNQETLKALGGAALILLDNAVGEYDAVMKITQLDRGPLPLNPQRSPSFFPLPELPQFLDAIPEA